MNIWSWSWNKRQLTTSTIQIHRSELKCQPTIRCLHAYLFLFQKRPDPFNALIIFTTWLYVKGFLMKDKNVDRATRQESDNIDFFCATRPGPLNLSVFSMPWIRKFHKVQALRPATCASTKYGSDHPYTFTLCTFVNTPQFRAIVQLYLGGQLSNLNTTLFRSMLLKQLGLLAFISNWQLPFLNQL